MTDPLIRADALSKTFDLPGGETVPVLKDISCEIAPGQRIALIGPSGSGKSTLLHLMAGLIDPSSGMITWPELGPREGLMPCRVQVVFQSPSLYPPLNVVENVALPLLLARRHDEAEARAMAMLTRFGLAELSGKLPEELSGGQAQRVAMARALAIGPELVLADEPTGQLDGATAQAFLDELLAIATEGGTAVVIATHDLRVASRMRETWTLDHGVLHFKNDRIGALA